MDKEYADRISRLQGLIRGRGWRGVMLLKPENHRYLTGFNCAVNNVERLMALLVPAEGEPVFVLPRLEVTLGRAAGVEKTIGFYYTELFEKLHEGFDLLGWNGGRVGTEWSYLTIDKSAAIQAWNQAGSPGGGARSAGPLQLVDCSGLVSSLRLIKTPREIEWFEKAAAATDRAAAVAREFVRPGVTERELAGALTKALLDAGAEAPAFFPTVQAGVNATLPNMCPTDHALAEGEIVVVDFGAAYMGIRTDICRSFAVGEVPAKARQLHKVVREAQADALAKVVPGRPAADVHRAAAETIERAGYGPYFNHAVGHGVGYDVHEAPSVAAHNEEPLRPGMVLSIEPGIYVDGIGVRIEDVVLVTEKGGRVLTRADRDL